MINLYWINDLEIRGYRFNELPINIEGDFLPLHYVLTGNFKYSSINDNGAYKYNSLINGSKFIKSTIIDANSYTKYRFLISTGGLIRKSLNGRLDVLYTLMVPKENKEAVLELAKSKQELYTSGMQLWVKSNFRVFSSTLYKIYKPQIEDKATELGIQVIEKPDFKELFIQPHQRFKTIKEFNEFKDNLVNEL